MLVIFELGWVAADDFDNYEPDIFIAQLWSIKTIKIIVQDIGKEGHNDCSDLSSFINRHILKHVTNEPDVVVTDVYGTVVNVYCKVLSPHENDPVEKAEFMIHFDSQEIIESITICFLK